MAFGDQRTYPECYFARFADDDCSGRLDKCHLIRQQDIRREHELANPRTPTAWIPATTLTGTDLDELLNDSRVLVGGCRHHHYRADKGYLPYEIPPEVYDFAEEFGLQHYLPVRITATTGGEHP